MSFEQGFSQYCFLWRFVGGVAWMALVAGVGDSLLFCQMGQLGSEGQLPVRGVEEPLPMAHHGMGMAEPLGAW